MKLNVIKKSLDRTINSGNWKKAEELIGKFCEISTAGAKAWLNEKTTERFKKQDSRAVLQINLFQCRIDLAEAEKMLAVNTSPA